MKLNFIKFKKCVSPVVATALLLVVAVVSVVGFQGWFTSFSSGLIADVESDTASSISTVRVDGIINNDLYLNSNSENVDLKSLSVLDSSGVEVCSFKTSSVNESNLDNGLIGYWRMDNGSGLDILDLSGNNNHGKLFGTTKLVYDFDVDNGLNVVDETNFQNNGTVFGATWTNSGCLSGGCYDFDGVDDYIVVNVTKSLNFKDEFSVSFWISADSNSGPRTLFSAWENGVSDGLYIQKGSTGTIAFVSRFQNGNGAFKDDNLNISVGQFYHVVVTYSKSSSKVFVNGNLSANFDGDFEPLINSSVFHIGRHISNHYPFDGKIDELSIYGKALSVDEINNLYNSQKVQFFDYKNNLVYFDGQSASVEIKDAPILRVTDNLTILTKYNVLSDGSETAANRRNIVVKNGAYYLNFDPNVDKITVYSYWTNSSGEREGSAYDYSNYSIDFNKWYVGAFTEENGSRKIYENGIKTFDGVRESSIYPNNLSLTFGNEGVDETINRHLHGFIEWVKIYDRALSSDKISNVYLSNVGKGSKIKKIDLSGCNLSSNSKYEIVGTTKNGLFNYEVISR